MDAFPAYFSLKGATVAVAGTGDLAEAKARLFEGSPAEIRRLMGADALARSAYEGCVLAFIADPDETFCKAAARAAREAGCVVNVTDKPALSDFSTPAIIDRGAVVAAVGTAGASPILAATLRGEIEALLPEATGRIAILLSRLRDVIRQARPDLAQRRDFLRRALDGPAAAAALGGRMDDAEQLLREALARPAGERVGSMTVIDGSGPADLLTIRQLRMLGEADVVAAGEGVDPDILARARRDAPRTALDIPALIRRVTAGDRVVCVARDPLALAIQVRAQGLDL